MQRAKLSPEEIAKKREEAERKARRGEIDPMQEFSFTVIGHFTGIMRHEMMEFMFADPTMLDDLDYLFKSDMARRLMFYHQPEYKPEPPPDKSGMTDLGKRDDINRPNMLRMQVSFEINQMVKSFYLIMPI